MLPSCNLVQEISLTCNFLTNYHSSTPWTRVQNVPLSLQNHHDPEGFVPPTNWDLILRFGPAIKGNYALQVIELPFDGWWSLSLDAMWLAFT